MLEVEILQREMADVLLVVSWMVVAISRGFIIHLV